MEVTGTIIALEQDLAKVALAAAEGGGETVFARNVAGGRVGDRVRVLAPEPVTGRQSNLAYAAPLAGLALGATAGRVLPLIPTTAERLTGLGGPMFGRLLTNGDNLALAGGLLGLGLAMAGLALWLRQKQRASGPAKIIAVLPQTHEP